MFKLGPKGWKGAFSAKIWEEEIVESRHSACRGPLVGGDMTVKELRKAQ